MINDAELDQKLAEVRLEVARLRLEEAEATKQANIEKIEVAKQCVYSAVRDSAWDAVSESLAKLLWTLAELRPDFEELPLWISEANESGVFDRHADCGVAIAERVDSILSSVVSCYGDESERVMVSSLKSTFLRERASIETSDLAIFLADLAAHAARLHQGVRRLPLARDKDELLIGRYTRISFNRTLRIPEDGREYPLPAGFGRLPILRVEDYAKRVPEQWLEQGGFIIPLYQREALFLSFACVAWRPTIAKVSVGRINAISGKEHDLKIRPHRQDYVVIPEQRWLDGINSGDGIVSQFVAMPLGKGYTIEAQITDEEKFGGFQLAIFDPRTGRFPEQDPKESEAAIAALKQRALQAAALPKATVKMQQTQPLSKGEISLASARPRASQPLLAKLQTEEAIIDEMGIAAGGSIKQQIIEDTYGAESWDEDARRDVVIHIVNSEAFHRITGLPAPPSPITADDYSRNKIPWYSDYEEKKRVVAPAGIFKRIFSIGRIDRSRGITSEEPLPKHEIDSEKIVRIRTPSVDERYKSLVLRAQRSSKNQQYKIAIREASLALDLKDGSLPLQIRAHAHLCLGNALDAEADASSCLKIDSKNFEALSIRAMASLHLGEYLLARNDAEKVLAFDPKAKDALYVHQQATLKISKTS